MGNPIKIGGAALLIYAMQCAPADADPIITPIFAGVQAFLAAGGLVTAAGGLTALGQITLAVASLGLSIGLQALAGKPKAREIDPGQAKDTFKSDESSEIRAIGRVRIGGLKAFGNTNGANRYRVICHCKGEVDGVEEYYLGGREVIVDSDGAVSSPPYAKLGGSWVYIKEKAGTGSETAWTELITAFPTLWTAEHRIRGIAQSLIQYISPGLSSSKFLELYQSGVPDLEKVMRVDKPFDPRTGTYTWTQNGVLCLLHIAVSFPRFSFDDFDLAQIAVEATKADALIPKKGGGTVKRCLCSGVWPSEDPRGDILDQVKRSLGLEIRQTSNDKYGIFIIDDNRPAEHFIEQRDIIDLVWRSGPENVERPNICRVKYYSPERNYVMAEIDLKDVPWARVQNEIDRVGEQIIDINLPFCQNASQAQHIARRMFAEKRGESGVVITNFAGLAVWGRRTVDIDFPDIGIKRCEILPPRINDSEGTVEIPFIVQPALEEWNVDVHEAVPPPAIPDLAFTSNITTPSTPSSATVVTYPNTTKHSRVAIALPAGATDLEASYRTYSGGVASSWVGLTEYAGDSGYRHAYTSTDLTGVLCDFRVRGVNGVGDVSFWSETLNVSPAQNNTAPAAPLLTGSNNTFDLILTLYMRAPDSLNVAYCIYDPHGSAPPVTVAVKPGELFTYTYTYTILEASQTLTFTATAYNSANVASSTASLSFTIAGSGGGG